MGSALKMIRKNDLCWCESGMKYRSCHLKKDLKLKVLKYSGYDIPEKELIKTKNQIEGIRKSAKVTREILDLLDSKVKSGMKTIEIDSLVYNYAVSKSAIPATIGYEGYEHSCCTSVNDMVCHGIPDETILKDGDIVNVDITINLDGYYSDASRMIAIGEISCEAKTLIDCTKECLRIGIESVKPYKPVNVIGDVIEPFAIGNGYSVVEELTGHGVGLALHELPIVCHFPTKVKGMILVPGMVITIEPMINQNGKNVKLMDDKWGIKTEDGGLSAQWEHTILITEDGTEILT